MFGFNPPHTPRYYATGSITELTATAKAEERRRDRYAFGSQDEVGRRKRYELLGNSVSVTVLKELLAFLLVSAGAPPLPHA